MVYGSLLRRTPTADRTRASGTAGEQAVSAETVDPSVGSTPPETEQGRVSRPVGVFVVDAGRAWCRPLANRQRLALYAVTAGVTTTVALVLIRRLAGRFTNWRRQRARWDTRL